MLRSHKVECTVVRGAHIKSRSQTWIFPLCTVVFVSVSIALLCLEEQSQGEGMTGKALLAARLKLGLVNHNLNGLGFRLMIRTSTPRPVQGWVHLGPPFIKWGVAHNQDVINVLLVPYVLLLPSSFENGR